MYGGGLLVVAAEPQALHGNWQRGLFVEEPGGLCGECPADAMGAEQAPVADLAAEPIGQLAANGLFEFAAVRQSDDGDADQRSAGRGIFWNDVADDAQVVDWSLTITVEYQNGVCQRSFGGIEVQAGGGSGGWCLHGLL